MNELINKNNQQENTTYQKEQKENVQKMRELIIANEALQILNTKIDSGLELLYNNEDGDNVFYVGGEEFLRSNVEYFDYDDQSNPANCYNFSLYGEYVSGGVIRKLIELSNNKYPQLESIYTGLIGGAKEYFQKDEFKKIKQVLTDKQ
jgi:hypothetical protein